MKLTYFLLFLVCNLFVLSQDNELIQFSGNVLTTGEDTLELVPFVLVKNKSRNSGAYSGLNGNFSLVVKRGDTIEFSSIGFKKSRLIVPNNIQNNHFYASQLILRDTNVLPEVIIVPWKNINELKKAFIDLELTEDDIIIAYQNMQYSRWQKLSETLPLSSSESQYNTLKQNNAYNSFYQHGVLPNNNLLNPLAWYEFINYLQNNKKSKSKKNLDTTKEP